MPTFLYNLTHTTFECSNGRRMMPRRSDSTPPGSPPGPRTYPGPSFLSYPRFWVGVPFAFNRNHGGDDYCWSVRAVAVHRQPVRVLESGRIGKRVSPVAVTVRNIPELPVRRAVHPHLPSVEGAAHYLDVTSLDEVQKKHRPGPPCGRAVCARDRTATAAATSSPDCRRRPGRGGYARP